MNKNTKTKEEEEHIDTIVKFRRKLQKRDASIALNIPKEILKIIFATKLRRMPQESWYVDVSWRFENGKPVIVLEQCDGKEVTE